MIRTSLRSAFLILPLAACTMLTGCAGPAYYGDQGYGPDATVYIADSSRPHYYDNSPYYYSGRYYTGGRYETGQYKYKGRTYDNRYYHNGQYLYGGSRQSRPNNGPGQNNYGNQPYRGPQPQSNQSHGQPVGNHHGGPGSQSPSRGN